MKKLNSIIFSFLKQVFSYRFVIYFSRILYSLALIYFTLYFLFEHLLKQIYNSVTRTALHRKSFGAGYMSAPMDEYTVFILPLVVTGVIYGAVYCLFKYWKGKDVKAYMIVSWLITAGFTFITLVSAFHGGDIQGSSFSEIGAGRIIAFMILYGVPITVALYFSENTMKQLVLEILFFVSFAVLSAYLHHENNPVTIGRVSASLHSMGIFYFTATLVVLSTLADYVGADMDTDIRTTLLYLILPVFLLISFFLIGTLILTGGIYWITGIKPGMELFLPFEYIYFHLKQILFYRGCVGLFSSMAAVISISMAAMALFKKIVHDYDGLEGFHVIRTFGGIIALSYFLVHPLSIPLYVSLPLVSCILWAGWYFGRKLFFRAVKR